MVTKSGRLVEIKNSMGAVKEAQFKEFVEIYSKGAAPGMTMIFKEMPTAAEVAMLEKWTLDVLGPGGSMPLAIIFVR
jgi:hypothetical protein